MKKIIHAFLLFFLCTIAFAQDGPPPPDFEDPNDPNPTDQPVVVPIDSHVIGLAIGAVFLGLYMIWRKKYSHS
ncbi:MAG: hypothetical protein ABIP27_11640 [Flavobacterium circumlabens]|uniref:Signal peptidase n=1 Tax=Flavobacterium circumlabens TaxID=2133765 RepID=A0A4Y7UCZ4_9FLAO|nr:hypothetical protein [Flavobacterium circumlabens]TCN58909.1 hypothetical protein EV142_103356 [Flavobacterium circumlabens]TEB44317.1 hypothetical protein D0809_11205 [Flavobacterium circumlabens]